MELTPATTAPATAALQTTGAQTVERPTISSDFETFLKMLTAQISNQDPLDPMKSEEFAVQLATFSGVEQQVRSNELLESLLGKLGGDQFSAMSTFIGREARAPMPAHFGGRPIQVDPEQPIAGSRHDLVVRDVGGTEIYRSMIDSTGNAVVWDGRTTRGGTAPSGTYSFAVESFDSGALVATEPAAVYARVGEVRQSQDGAMLVFAGGVEISADAVTALREAAAPTL